MNLQPAKRLALRLGMYRPARWLERHVLHPSSLRTLQKDRDFLRPLVAQGALCFDIGANNGAKSEVLLDLGARVVAVEPQEMAVAEMAAQLKGRPGLTILKIALSDQEGIATLHIARSPTASSLVDGWGEGIVGHVDVPVLTLDRLIEKYGRPDYCKIDVEGSDTAVLRGLSHPLPLISFEFHFWSTGVAECREALDYLARLGNYRFNYTRQDTPGFCGPAWGTQAELLDWLGLSKSDSPPSDYGDIFARLT